MPIDNQWGYAIVRADRIVATELTLALAERWLFSEIIPLCPASERNDLQREVASMKEQRDQLLNAAETIGINAEECLDFDECTAMLIPIDDYHKLMEAADSAKPDHVRDTTKMMETTVPAIVFYPAGSLGEEITP